MDRPVQCLSGGEKQKLAIACAVASGRDLIVLDEPTSHLDPPGRRDLLAHILGSSWRDRPSAGGNPAVVLITQYLEDARRFPRVVMLHQGAVVYDGTADGWQGLPASSAHGNFIPQPSIPGAPVIVTTDRLSQLAQPSWPLPSSPLSDVTIQIRAGDAIGLCGPIGSGKSTLGYHLAGLFDSYAGTRDVAGSGQPQRSPVVMIQFPERQLFCATVGDDVAFGPSARGNERKRAVESAAMALETMGLPPAEFWERSPFELSAGQQRRAGMAGVAACSAPFYILDEPTAALDADGLARLESLLAQWQGAGVAYLIISHDLDWLAQITHRVWVMDAGHILFDGVWSDSVQLDPVLASIGFRDSH
jgi:energy-coupling factor transport system ATP-binding protein